MILKNLIGKYVIDAKKFETIDWQPPFTKDWELVDLEVYKYTEYQARIRHDEVLSESESITTKTFYIVGALSAFFAFLLPFRYEFFCIPNKIYSKALIISLLAVSIYLLVLIMTRAVELLFPKRVILRGDRPCELLSPTLDILKEEDREYQLKKVFIHEIIKLDNRIKFMAALNTARAATYRWILIAAFLCMILSSVVLFSPFG